MPNENHNNNFNWKTRLEQLDNIPGNEMMDKNAAWEILHGRMKEKPKRKRMIWYWAAACLATILLSTIFLFFHKKENNLVQNSTIKSAQQHIIDTGNNAKATVIVSNKAVKEKLQSLQAIRKKDMAFALPQPKPTTEPIENNIIIPKAVSTETPAIAILTKESIAATILPVKKKLTIVHINELGNDVMDNNNADNYHQSLQGYFQIKLNNTTEVKNGPFALSKQPGILKINLSSKN